MGKGSQIAYNNGIYCKSGNISIARINMSIVSVQNIACCVVIKGEAADSKLKEMTIFECQGVSGIVHRSASFHTIINGANFVNNTNLVTISYDITESDSRIYLTKCCFRGGNSAFGNHRDIGCHAMFTNNYPQESCQQSQQRFVLSECKFGDGHEVIASHAPLGGFEQGAFNLGSTYPTLTLANLNTHFCFGFAAGTETGMDAPTHSKVFSMATETSSETATSSETDTKTASETDTKTATPEMEQISELGEEAPTSEPVEDTGQSIGVIAGSVAGGVAVVGGAAVGLGFLLKRKGFDARVTNNLDNIDLDPSDPDSSSSNDVENMSDEDNPNIAISLKYILT
jgi:hypothetical protein